MAKIKLTKNELKKQKDLLKMFQRYLPTLQLKKQQLQIEIAAVQEKAAAILAQLEAFQARLDAWVALYGEEFPFDEYLSVKELVTGNGNIAGVDIPIFEKVSFTVREYDLFETPLWIDHGFRAIQDTISLRLQHEIYQEQNGVWKLNCELRLSE